MCIRYLNRFKNSVKSRADFVSFIDEFSQWFDIWEADVTATPPRFTDSITSADASTRRLVLSQLREEITRLVSIAHRESEHGRKVVRPATQAGGMTAEQRRQARIMQLKYAYDPPGELREGGWRHDNDFADIAQIRVAPTHEELLCPQQPYLPVFLPDAPHHLPADSMERHLDIQFRLLREELMYVLLSSFHIHRTDDIYSSPLRSAINVIDNDIETMHQTAARAYTGKGKGKKDQTTLETLLARGGGAYKTRGFDGVFFRVYAHAAFLPVKAERRDLTVGLALDAPPGGARAEDAKKRVAFWEHSRLLQRGSLVALCVAGAGLRVFLGTVSSGGPDIGESARAEATRVQVRVAFFDPEVELLALRGHQGETMFLVDNDVMYEASRPFLERLQSIEPTEIPFARYIARGGDLADVPVLPPKYATAPRFKFKLGCLAKNTQSKAGIQDLDVSVEAAVLAARGQMLNYSTLDPSQVDAVVNTLLREVSLIQGYVHWSFDTRMQSLMPTFQPARYRQGTPIPRLPCNLKSDNLTVELHWSQNPAASHLQRRQTHWYA